MQEVSPLSKEMCSCIKEIAMFSQKVNHSMLSPPFIPNTISLWREIKFSQFRDRARELLVEGSTTDAQIITEINRFIQEVDNEIFVTLKAEFKKTYIATLDYNKLGQLNKNQVKADPAKLKNLLEKDLSDVKMKLSFALADWQLEIETQYDLLKRINSYELDQFEDEQFTHLQEKKNPEPNWLLDLMMDKLVENIGSFSKNTIKDGVARATMAQGIKSFTERISSKSSILALGQFNVGVLIGGYFADFIVSNIKEKLEISKLRKAINEQSDELFILASEYQQQIQRCFAVNIKAEQFEQEKRDLKIFILKHFGPSPTTNLFYSKSDQKFFTQTEVDDVTLIEEYKEPIKSIQLDEQIDMIGNVDDLKVDMGYFHE